MNSIKHAGLSLLSCAVLIACGEGTPGPTPPPPPPPTPKFVLNDTGVNYFIDNNAVAFDEDLRKNPVSIGAPREPTVTYTKSGSPRIYGAMDTAAFPKMPPEAFTGNINEPSEFPGQDGSFGRDLNANPNDGLAGFEFVKLDKLSGAQLDISAAEYGCVKDNVTGLVWEHKTKNQSDIHRAGMIVSWYDPNPNTNGGEKGQQDGGACTQVEDDTYSFIGKVNQEKLCGLSNWRLPTIEEMRSLVNYQVKDGTLENPGMVDQRFFPNLSARAHRWSSQTVYGTPLRAFGFHFHDGFAQAHDKNCMASGNTNNDTGYDNGVLLVHSSD